MPLTTFVEFALTLIVGMFVGALIYDQYGKENEIIKLEKRMEKLEEKNNAKTT